MLPGGVQRRAAGARRGLSGGGEVVGQRDPAPGDHPGEDHRGARLVMRGAQCGVGAVGQRLPAGLAQLLRLPVRQAAGAQGRPATVQIAQGSPAVVSAHPQRIQPEAQRPVVCGQGRRGPGALVTRAAQHTIVGHDHPRTRRPPLRELRRRSARHAAAGNRPGGWGGCGDYPPGDNRHHRRATSRRCEPEALGPQTAKTRTVGAGEVPPAERIEQQEQNAAQGRHCARQGRPSPAGLPPQAGFDVGAREPSNPRRRPQHCGHGQKPSPRSGDFRCGVGPVRADHRRESQPLRAHHAHGVAVVGVEQNMLSMRESARRTAAANPAVDVPGVPGRPRPRPQRRQSHSRRRAGGETKRLWSPAKSSHHSGGTGR
ncbi:hypothetical protein C1Y40_01103 [Mycobacterium talmoniae]|uniref:Uncharacterized protein n=1 Tax=Mycobacterium talmoniae TaxID=1858794 RepID=A0A2S8BPY6_9MYCO|nr:hypothetical protein C1Y40_01103 [Mycobacterium talmoniae]